MSSRKRKLLTVVLTAVMTLGIQSVIPADNLDIGHFSSGNVVYADNPVNVSLSVERTSGNSAKQGEERVPVIIEIKNTGSREVEFDSAELKLDEPDSIAVTGGETGNVTLGSEDEDTITFYLNVGGNAETGSRDMELVLKSGTGEAEETVYTKQLGIFRIGEKLATTSGDRGTVVSSDIVHSISPSGGFSPGQDNVLTLNLKNIGNTVIKNAVLSLTLPEELSVYNSSNSANLGYISVGSTRDVSFPITVDEDAVSKNYAVTVELSGLSYYNDEVSSDKTFYIPVNGSGGSLKNAEITNISIPSEVSGDDEFTLSFDVVNQSGANLKNVKINVDVPEGLLNKTRSAFVESSIPAGSSRNYSVKLFADDSAKEKAYPIKISLSSSASISESDAVIQYASVYVAGISGEKTPQLMVADYGFGGTYVEAGEVFSLDLGLYNTSSAHDISNIKVTINSEDGSIIPVNSSNSFYIERLDKKERTDYSLMLSVKPTAEQKTTALNVDMSYEDGSGNTFESKDIISIPVMQDTRLEVDDVIAPPELYVGMQSGVSVQFYNMGKTVLSNLRVTAEGDFDTPESNSYFVGNMESGKSDSYDFSFIPRAGGTMEGKIIFTYEDASGSEQVLERPFSFEVMGEMPVFNEMPPEEMGDEGNGKLKWIIGAVILALAVIGVIIWRKRRKKKINQEMEIDE